MDEERLRYLLRQYISGQASPDEFDEMLVCLESPDSDDLLRGFVDEVLNDLEIKVGYPESQSEWIKTWVDEQATKMKRMQKRVDVKAPTRWAKAIQLFLSENRLRKSYFKTAWRHLLNSKTYSLINVMGLATGMAVALLIGLWLGDELTFDHYHGNHARLAQVMYVQTNNGERTTSGELPIPLRDELQGKFGSRFNQLALTSHIFPFLLSTGEKKITQPGMFVQPDFPAMFTLHMVSGSADVLKDPSSIMISSSLAKELFGDTDPINKIVKVSERISVKISAVYEDLPQRTTLSSVKVLGSLDKFISVAGMQDAQTQWGNRSFFLYVLLNGPADKTTAAIKNIPGRHMAGSKDEIFLHPMDKWHLYSDFSNGKISGGRIQYVWLFGLIGAFVLLLACINFMNLSTARSSKRAKEVGIRKAIGSLRGQLIIQFLSESILTSFIACILALALAGVTLPFFNSLAGKQMVIPSDSLLFWGIFFVFVVFVGLISGSYPAFYLSGFKPIRVLKGVFKAGPMANLPRKVLVAVQFTVSIALIAGTLIIFKQLQYAKDRPVGYSRAGLISLTMYAGDGFKRYEPFRDELLKTGVVDEMAESSSPSTHIWNNYGNLNWKGKDPGSESMFGMVAVTHDFGRALGWQIKEGRDFSRSYPTDTGSFIINETAAKLTGFKHPVGEIMNWEGKDHVITGVVKDLVMESPFTPVKPTVFFLEYGDWLDFITIKINPTVPAHEALTKIEPIFKKFNGNSPFDYAFTDEEYAKKFSDEVRLGSLASIFASLAIFISCLGLFGLASFVAEQRTKEISVRKVLGASVFHLWKLLSQEFLALVFISCLIASPVAWYFLHQWLQKYDYRIDISWWLFAEAGLAALLITLLTVSYQTIRTALANPAKSLKAE